MVTTSLEDGRSNVQFVLRKNEASDIHIISSNEGDLEMMQYDNDQHGPKNIKQHGRLHVKKGGIVKIKHNTDKDDVVTE